MKLTLRPLIATAATCCLVATSTPPALAQGDDEAEAKAAIVMDLSGSMLEADEGGTRLDSAKQATTELIDALPDTANIGMVVYGQTESSAPDNREAGCRDIQTLSPVQRIDKEDLKDKIADLEASGYTPMGNALLQAAEELGDSGDRSIILVSDGIDTCAPPPVCEVAEQLGGQGFNLTIHTVGFHADSQAQRELECIADATGGQFLHATNTRELADTLKFLATRDMVKYQTVGTEFEFAETPADAQWLGEGRYRTKVVPKVGASSPQPYYYRVVVPEGHNAVFIIKAIPNKTDEGDGEQSVVSKVAAATNDTSSKCQSFRSADSAGVRNYANGYSANAGTFGIIQLDPKEGADPSCDQTQWVIENNIYVPEDAANSDFRDQEVEVEVEVQFEPQVMALDREQLHRGYPGVGDSVPAISFSNPQKISGAYNFADAPVLENGQVYEDVLVRGEMKYYKIPVEWGQRPVVGIQRSENELNDDRATPTITILNPFYGAFSAMTNDEPIDGGRVVAPDRPTEFMNREVNQGGLAHSFAGYYYAGVSLSEYAAENLLGVEQPFKISAVLEGEPTIGHAWRPSEDNGPAPSDEPILAAGATPSTAATTTPPTNDDEANLAAQQSGRSTTGIIAAGLVVLLLGVVIGLIGAKQRANRNRPNT